MASDNVPQHALRQDPSVDFNKVNLALAKRQSMLASLMGLSSAGEPPPGPVDKETSNTFAAEPELLGVGAKKQDGDEDNRPIHSSEDRLKRHLLSKDSDKRQTISKQSIKSRKELSNASTTSRERAPPVEQPRRDELDSDEDAGRSSLGKRKRKRKSTGENDLKDAKAGSKDGEAPADEIGESVEKPALIQPVEACVGDALSEKSSKKKKKKKKN